MQYTLGATATCGRLSRRAATSDSNAPAGVRIRSAPVPGSAAAASVTSMLPLGRTLADAKRGTNLLRNGFSGWRVKGPHAPRPEVLQLQEILLEELITQPRDCHRGRHAAQRLDRHRHGLGTDSRSQG